MYKGPPGTWEILSSPGKKKPAQGAGGECQSAQASGRVIERPGERKNQCDLVTVPRRQRSAAGVAGSLSALIVPSESRVTEPEGACE